jgi:adenylate kinase family enzyme
LEDREEELKKILEEAEKKKKGKKLKKGEEEPEINHAEFKYLTKPVLIEMIQERLKEEDCNAGAIFDNLESHHYPNTKFVIDAICEAMPKQNIQMVVFQIQKEEISSHEFEVCTNYRYMRRKDD